MVKKSTLERFIKLGGYDVVKQKDGTWRGIAEAARTTGIGQMTIRRLLEKYPTEPHKGEAKYVQEFQEAEGYKRFKAKYGLKKSFRDAVLHVRNAWLILNKKDPISWNESDYDTIWNHEKFFKKTFQGKRFEGVPEHPAAALHNLMRVTGKADLLKLFQGKKYPKGGKKEWYLEEEEIIRLTSKFEYNDTLVMSLLGFVKGGRWSSLVLATPEKVNSKDLSMLDYEPKRSEWVSRIVQERVMRLLMRYIRDYQIEPKERLFTESYTTYLRRMKAAGVKAGIKKTVSTHIMKHTFVSQASKHGVSLDTVVAQTGTDPATLQLHYKARNEPKLKHELLGTKWEFVPFPEWIDGLMPYFEENYQRIILAGGGALKLNGKR